MTEHGDQRTDATVSAAGWITPLQGLASIGAGVIHAAAAGIHAEHATLTRLFVALAAAQILVGMSTLLRGGRAVAVVTALVNGTAVVAWIVTRVSGISWIEGLEQSEAPQFADTVCAALGVLAVGAAVVTLRGGAGRTTRATPSRFGLLAIGLGAVTVAAMMSSATHAHSGDAGQDHGHPEAADDEGATTTTHPHAGAGEGDPVAVAYDPTRPIDLSGVDGVTPEQQAFAENLVAVNVVRLPQWADPAVAEAAGFHSVGDADSGHEHYVQWDWIDDEVWLDPDAPESLVYEPQPDGSKKLVSAMYMLPTRRDAGGGARRRRCVDAMAHPRRSLLDRPSRRPPDRRAHPPRRHLSSAARQARRVGDDPRLDRSPRVRAVRRPRGCRSRNDPGGRGTMVRPRPRLVTG